MQHVTRKSFVPYVPVVTSSHPQLLVQQFQWNFSAELDPVLPFHCILSKWPASESLEATRSLLWQMPKRLVHGILMLLLIYKHAAVVNRNCAILRRAYGTHLWRLCDVLLYVCNRLRMKYSVPGVTTSPFYHFCAVLFKLIRSNGMARWSHLCREQKPSR